jgi:hypothetical protein
MVRIWLTYKPGESIRIQEAMMPHAIWRLIDAQIK